MVVHDNFTQDLYEIATSTKRKLCHADFERRNTNMKVGSIKLDHLRFTSQIVHTVTITQLRQEYQYPK